MRKMVRGIAMAAAVSASLLFSSTPASASPTMNWKVVSTDSNWHCSGWAPAQAGLNMKTCIVVNSSHWAQAVLVFQNASTLPKAVNGRIVFESTNGGGEYGGGDAWCAASTLQPGLTRGCFAPSVPIGCRYTDKAESTYTKPADAGWILVPKDPEYAC